MRKLKTPLALRLQKALQKAILLEKHPDRFASVDDIAEAQYREARRRFLVNSAKAGAALYLGGGLLSSCVSTPPKPKKDAGPNGPVIAIVGGGIAGLHAGYLLKKAGYMADIYEGAARLGGRIFSLQGLLGEGLSTEMGGEFIDSSHEDMLNLAKEFDLPMLDRMAPSEEGLVGDAFHFNGRFYSEREVIKAFQPMAAQLEKDLAFVTDEIGYDASTPDEKRLDNTPLEAYIDKLPGEKWFKQMLNLAYTSEMGIDSGNQSALNLITFISTDTKSFEIFGDSDERYTVIGGNSKITDRLAKELEAQIKTTHVLQALHQKNGKYMLKFSNGKEVTADFVILALPFTKLREVDLQLDDMPAYKTEAIQKLAFGTNSKLLLGYSDRVWRKEGHSGYLFNTLIQNGWDNSHMQHNNEGPGGYTVFLGGKAGTALSNATREPYIQEMNKVYKGAKAAFSGKTEIFNWTNYEMTHGSYACYGVGQWTTISGAEIEPVGNVFFAGEHCSSDFQGYMNGGAETGRVAAEAVLEAVKAK